MQRIVLDAPQDLQKINRFLREYVGFSIQLWAYSVSHSHLDLRLHRGTAGNFHLRFAAVNAILLPQLNWQLNGQVNYDESQRHSRYVFVDENASVRIESDLLRFEENVEPVY